MPPLRGLDVDGDGIIANVGGPARVHQYVAPLAASVRTFRPSDLQTFARSHAPSVNPAQNIAIGPCIWLEKHCDGERASV
jgi:hypothetical protein